MGLDTQAAPATRPPQEGEVSEDFARQILLRRLEAQPRSRTELADALRRKNVPADVAERLLDRFEEVGLIDDAAFARMWVDSRVRTRGLARTALAMELRRKGIADEVVREVLGDLDPDAERQAAHRLVQKKLRSMSNLDDAVRIRRLVGMLARKGYSPQMAFDVVRAELES
jgi:regulatory protein